LNLLLLTPSAKTSPSALVHAFAPFGIFPPLVAFLATAFLPPSSFHDHASPSLSSFALLSNAKEKYISLQQIRFIDKI
jgi:hypothetical protein